MTVLLSFKSIVPAVTWILLCFVIVIELGCSTKEIREPSIELVSFDLEVFRHESNTNEPCYGVLSISNRSDAVLFYLGDMDGRIVDDHQYRHSMTSDWTRAFVEDLVHPNMFSLPSNQSVQFRILSYYGFYPGHTRINCFVSFQDSFVDPGWFVSVYPDAGCTSEYKRTPWLVLPEQNGEIYQ